MQFLEEQQTSKPHNFFRTSPSLWIKASNIFEIFSLFLNQKRRRRCEERTSLCNHVISWPQAARCSTLLHPFTPTAYIEILNDRRIGAYIEYLLVKFWRE